MKRILLILVTFLSFFTLRADEGMWLPMLIERLNYVDMQKEGLQLTPEEIYSVNNSSIKDAIVHFGGGCTGEIVSANGLLFTNHHCGYSNIQALSTVEDNILENGFFAKSFAEERPCPGLTVRFLVRMEDVTAIISDGLFDSGKTMAEIRDSINARSKVLQKEASEDDKYIARVTSFYNGNEFYLFVYQVFNDVRLVGTPPENIGKFGADTDNWMWPRHTGDFSVFRVYADSNNNPAAYSEDNVPFTPKHFLPISIAPKHKDDFAMVMGFPGSTDRYATSFDLKNKIENGSPNLVQLRRKHLDIMEEFQNKDEAIRLQYANKHASIANYWKYYLGETQQIKRNKVIEKKQAMEAEFSKYADAHPEYANVLDDFKKQAELRSKYTKFNVYGGEGIMAIEALELATEISYFIGYQGFNEESVAILDDYARDFYKDYYKPIDLKTASTMLKTFYENIDLSQQTPYFVNLVKKNKGDFDKIANNLFQKSIFVDENKFFAFLAKPSEKVLAKDPLVVLAKAFTNFEPQNYTEDITQATELARNASRLYMKGLREMSDKVLPPDANSTMRLTYGTIQDYYPADAVHYDFVTTMAGVMEKEDPDVFEFVVPAKLKELYEKKDFGQYAENGNIVTCFLTNNDITGGNSGSPVLNAKGELIGLAFDGNWEAMSGNIDFDPNLQRCISVDIRYVLFLIDKFAGAQNIIDELKIEK
jgi:hypothetical protein